MKMPHRHFIIEREGASPRTLCYMFVTQNPGKDAHSFFFSPDSFTYVPYFHTLAWCLAQRYCGCDCQGYFYISRQLFMHYVASMGDFHRFSHKGQLHNYFQQGGSVFDLVCLVVCLSEGLQKSYSPDFYETWWRGEIQATEEHIKFWSGFKSQGGCTSIFSLSLTLRGRAFRAVVMKHSETCLKGEQVQLCNITTIVTTLFSQTTVWLWQCK